MAPTSTTRCARTASEDVFDDPAYADALVRYRGPSVVTLGQYADTLGRLLGQTRDESPRVLDVGCGSGAFTVPLARLAHAHAGRVLALDRSGVMVARTRERVRRAGMTRCTSVRRGDFASFPTAETYSLIWASDVLHALPSLDRFSRRAAGLLRSRGAVAIRTSSHLQLRSYEWGTFFPAALRIDLHRHHEVGAICRSLAASGFCELQVSEVDETRSLPTVDYLAAFEARHLSSLRLIDDSDFLTGLGRMKRACEGRAHIVRNARTTLITARLGGGNAA